MIHDLIHDIQESEERVGSILDIMIPDKADHVREYPIESKVEYLVAMLLIERGHPIEWIKKYLKRNHGVILDHSFLNTYGFKDGCGPGKVKMAVKREFDRVGSIDIKAEPSYDW